MRRDRLVTVVALGVLGGAAWGYLAYVASAMSNMATSDMPGMLGMSITMPDMHAWSWMEFAALFVMWAVMMAAMMIPAAAPMVLTFAAIHRRRAAAGQPSIPTIIFLLGYLLVWAVYSLAAAAVQVRLHAVALLSPQMAATSTLFAGGVLIGAGIFQWTPLKRACLTACRSPLSFLTSYWRHGTAGALLLGLRHGLYCLGCCWALMALLFVAGVMNLLWVTAIAAFVLVEKSVPTGARVGRLAGIGMTAAGVSLLFRSFVSG